MKRILVGSTVGAIAYYVFDSPVLAAITAGSTYFLYEPDYVPFGVDNYPMMYLVMLLRRRRASFDHFWMYFGSEFQNWRKSIKMENFSRTIFVKFDFY
mgnify:CR=1 FL=1